MSIYGVVTLFFYIQVFYRRSHKRFLSQSKDLKGVDYSFYKVDQAWFLNQKPKELWMDCDGSKRHAYLLESQKDQPIVILLHGYTAQALGMASFAKVYHEHYGYNVLVVDAKGHGLSDGRFIGFGYAERFEVFGWMDILNQHGFKGPVVLHGVSMGGSTALFAKSEDTKHRIRGVIADSPFIHLKPIFKRQAKLIWHLPSEPFLSTLSFYTRIFNGYGLGKVNLFKRIDTLQDPLLILHGTHDHFVEYTQSIELKEKAPQVDLVLFEDSAHACAYRDDPLLYLKAVDAYLKKIQF